MDRSLRDLTAQILTDISEYMGFDAKEIFEQGDFIAIFGGAVRDSLAKKEIHDIDIACLPESAYHLKDFLLEKGYYEVSLYDKDTWEMYEHISVISEPWTFQNGKKTIQIIRPRFLATNGPNRTKFTCGRHPFPLPPLFTDEKAVNAYYSILSGVDITACGVFIEKNNHEAKIGGGSKNNEILLKESYKNAILHCLAKVFEIKENSGMYEKKRTDHRSFKLQDRGWACLDDEYGRKQKKLIVYQRILKLIKTELTYDYNCTIWGSSFVSNKEEPLIDTELELDQW